MYIQISISLAIEIYENIANFECLNNQHFKHKRFNWMTGVHRLLLNIFDNISLAFAAKLSFV